MTKPKRTHVVLPEELVREIDTLVGKRARSRFIVTAARSELQRQRQLQALAAAGGSWKDRNHPEFRDGTAVWVSKQRRLDNERFERIVDR